MKSVIVERIIAAAPEAVFARASNIPGAAQTIPGIKSVEMLTQGPVGKGTRWRETRVMYGKEATEEMWITGFDPPRGYVVEAESHGVHYRSTFQFAPAGAGTKLTMEFAGEPLNWFAKIFGFVLGGVMMGSVRKALEADLDAIKAACERS